MKKPSTVQNTELEILLFRDPKWNQRRFSGDEVTAALRNSKQVLSPVAPARSAAD